MGFNQAIWLIQTCSCPDDSLNQNALLRFPSSIDGSMQEAFLIVPNDPKPEGTHLVVNLHSWSADLNQRSDLEKLVFEKNWYYRSQIFADRINNLKLVDQIWLNKIF